LSYTNFEYSDLEIKAVGEDIAPQAVAWKRGIVKDGNVFGAHVASWYVCKFQ